MGKRKALNSKYLNERFSSFLMPLPFLGNITSLNFGCSISISYSLMLLSFSKVFFFCQRIWFYSDFHRFVLFSLQRALIQHVWAIVGSSHEQGSRFTGFKDKRSHFAKQICFIVDCTSFVLVLVFNCAALCILQLLLQVFNFNPLLYLVSPLI